MNRRPISMGKRQVGVLIINDLYVFDNPLAAPFKFNITTLHSVAHVDPTQFDFSFEMY